MDGASEDASVRARAPLLPPRGREAQRERAPTSSSSSSRPSATPRPRPPFLFLLSLSRVQRLLAPARRARARASAPRPQLDSICSRGRGPGGEEGRHAAVQSTGGRSRGRGDGRGLFGPPEPIAAWPLPGRPNRVRVGGAAFKVRCAVRWGRGRCAVPAGSGAEAAGGVERERRLPAEPGTPSGPCAPALPSGPSAAPRNSFAPHLYDEACSHFCEENGLEVGLLRQPGRAENAWNPRGSSAPPCLRFRGGSQPTPVLRTENRP